MIEPNTKSTFAYHGIVTTELYHGKQLIETHKYHNAGLPEFFRGLCQAIAGTPNAIDIVPSYILLFTMSNSATVQSITDWATFCEYLRQEEVSIATHCLPIDEVITKNVELIQSDSPVVQVQVRIPYSLINSDEVYALALFSAQGAWNSGLLVGDQSIDVDLMKEKALAFYKLLSSDGASWKPINLNRTLYDGSVVVNWQMSFNNVTE